MTTEIIPGYVAGNQTVHALRCVGQYASGQPRYEKRCSSSGRARHEPSPLDRGTPVTCKRCLAKLAAQ